MIETLQRWAVDRGYRVAWGPAEVLDEACAAVAACHARGELDERFWDEELAAIAGPGAVPGGGSVVVVAVPAPAHSIAFERPDGRLDAVVPPTYVRYRARFEDVRRDLAAHGLPGARIEHLDAPLKSVAACLGLVRYGRNNIAYAEGLGSYIQLCGFWSDAELPARPPLPPHLLDECATCGICAALCPTGAITDERVLLHAERCLTRANESEGEWPRWATAESHGCLIGCLACQRACPANPALPIEDSGLVFSTNETAALLAARPGSTLPGEAGVARKLAWLGLSAPPAVLGRNLGALLAGDGAAASGASGPGVAAGC
ncbi:MAG: 4Fe-4S double cluster binding domain-containing protein [Thermoanaerobaculaceae bacterium]